MQIQLKPIVKHFELTLNLISTSHWPFLWNNSTLGKLSIMVFKLNSAIFSDGQNTTPQ